MLINSNCFDLKTIEAFDTVFKNFQVSGYRTHGAAPYLNYLFILGRCHVSAFYWFGPMGKWCVIQNKHYFNIEEMKLP
jgi:hypothetical protein